MYILRIYECIELRAWLLSRRAMDPQPRVCYTSPGLIRNVPQERHRMQIILRVCGELDSGALA